MNINKLLPVGIAILSALPLAAQTTETPTPPAPPSVAVPPLPPLPPLDPADIEADAREFEADALEFELDAKEFELDAKEFELDATDFQLDAHDFELDASDFELDAKEFQLDATEFEMLPEGISINTMDSLQHQIREEILKVRESARAAREVQRDVRRIERDIRVKNRELRKMESQMNGDTAALRESLLQAEQALQSARESLKQINPSFSAVNFTLPSVRVSVDKDENGERHHIVVMGHGAVPDQCKNISVACKTSPSAYGGQNSETIVLEGNHPGSNDIWKREDRVVVISTSDSAEPAAQGGLSAGSSQIIIRKFKDTDGEKSSRTIYIRSFSSEGTDLADFPVPPSQTTMAPFTLGNNLILIGNDSLRLQDGSNEQMLIKVYHDSSSPKVTTSMVVITMARGRKVDTLSGGTSDVPTATEMAAASSSSAGYTLEANRPNPFSESTTINFVVPKEEHVTLTVFDAAGKPVKVLKDEVVPAGTHSVTCDARDLPSGLYLYRLVGGSFSETKTMTVTK